MNRSSTLICIGLIAICCSCASIVSKTSYPVSFDSTPRQASVVVTDRKGKEVFSGTTPTVARLRSGGGFFVAGKYHIVISKPGYATKEVDIKATLNNWYFGNIVFGGLIGLLIVDPATGAMYRLKDQDVNETLVAADSQASATSGAKRGLQIYDINSIPASWKGNLELISKN